MITILTTTNTAAQINSIIDSVDRLNELITVSDSEKNIRKGDKRIRVVENKIIPDLDWFDSEPPFLFPTNQSKSGIILFSTTRIHLSQI